jgi:hypothetical protein
MNNIDFDELFNHCIKLNESNKEKCLICHIPIQDDENYIKLSCNHYYHSLCSNYKSGYYTCIYCEKKSVPLNKNICTFILKKKKHLVSSNICGKIDCDYHKNLLSSIPIISSTTCTFILKSGINKNKPCKRVNCKYHKLI